MVGFLGNSKLISQVNLRLMLQSVRMLQPTYRSAVARHTGLSRATVTCGINALLAKQVVEETDAPPPDWKRNAKGGRPPRMLRVNARARQVLAIDLEPDCLRVALTDMLANPIAVREQLMDRRASKNMICNRMIALCHEVLAAQDKPELLGIGLCLPGLIDVDKGIAISSTNMPHWKQVPIRDLLEREFKTPVLMDRSMNLAALHEIWMHPELESCRMVLLSLRTGIGMSLVDRGQIYRGRGGFSGEIGHTVVNLNGPTCECGARGCLESYVSARAITERAQLMIDEGKAEQLDKMARETPPLRPELIYELAKKGDPDCITIVSEVATFIGIATANVINLLAPDMIVLAGSIDNVASITIDIIKQQIEQRALPRLRQDLPLRIATAKEKAPLLGAAVLVARREFEMPRLRRVEASSTSEGAPN